LWASVHARTFRVFSWANLFGCPLCSLEKTLQELREEKAKIESQLRDIREAETHSHSIANGAYKGTAAKIAQKVNEDRGKFDWFEDTVPIDEPCCLSVPDIQQLLELLRNLTPEKRATLNLQWPATLMSTEEFTTLVQNEMKAKNEYEALEGSINATPFLILDEETFLHVKTLKETLTTFRSEKQRLSESIHSFS